jgi:hypothetical protein
MAGKRYTMEQIISVLREAEVRTFRMFLVLDEFTCRCLAIAGIARSIQAG